MLQVRVDEDFALSEDTFCKLRRNSPAGGWFPALQELSWCITDFNFPYVADLFFSPHLKKITISASEHNIPLDTLPAIASIISTLPASALQLLQVDSRRSTMPWAYFKDTLSSVALRCGPSLVGFISPTPLSEAAVNHLIQLPRLRLWGVGGPPPSCSASSLPLVFPPLTGFILGEGAAHGWLSLFKSLDHNVSTTTGATPLSRVRESLISLNVENTTSPIIDISFTSPIQIFRNLVQLGVWDRCHVGGDNDQCAFKLNNDNVAELAMALPRLVSLLLGHPCSKNTCATTAACLLPISVHCINMGTLEIHFNTTNIVGDLANISEDPRLQELYLRPRCTLSRLNVHQMPLTLDEPGLKIVANGMITIFPYLKQCVGDKRSWGKLSAKIADLRRTKLSVSVILGFLFTRYISEPHATGDILTFTLTPADLNPSATSIRFYRTIARY